MYTQYMVYNLYVISQMSYGKTSHQETFRHVWNVKFVLHVYNQNICRFELKNVYLSIKQRYVSFT